MKTVKPPEVGAVVEPKPCTDNLTIKTEAVEVQTSSSISDKKSDTPVSAQLQPEVKLETKIEPVVSAQPKVPAVKTEPGLVKTEPTDGGSKPQDSTAAGTHTPVCFQFFRTLAMVNYSMFTFR